MFSKRLLIGALAATGFMALPSQADTIELTGVIRDFQTSHPDFETYPNTYNKVMATLGEDGKPVLDMTYYNLKKGTSGQSVYSAASFAQWFQDVVGVNISIPYSITLDNGQEGPGGVYSYAREKQMPAPYNYFFPIDNMGYGLTPNSAEWPLRWASGGVHNFHFTYELKTEFTYTDPATREDAMVFSFTGDDDVWVFINGKLAVDLGGVHSQKQASVNLDAAAEMLGLEPGGTYTLDLFFAERHTSESNFRIETTLQLKEVPPTTVSPLYD
ncbi:MAG: fibro-slime domain-containing protein [Phycisphaerales bacterium]